MLIHAAFRDSLEPRQPRHVGVAPPSPSAFEVLGLLPLRRTPSHGTGLGHLKRVRLLPAYDLPLKYDIRIVTRMIGDLV